MANRPINYPITRLSDYQIDIGSILPHVERRFRHGATLDSPGDVGQLRGVVDDRTRHAETRSIDRTAVDRFGLEERGDDRH